MKSLWIFGILLIFNSISSWCQVPAFPGAEGFGAAAKGGRGGEVIYVTNLNDSGPGSFRAACEASGPRTVMFKVGGTITLESTVKIENPYITIAGQSAPGGGICLRTLNDKTPLSMKTHDIIMRYIRIRPGSGVTPEGSDTKDALVIKSEDAHDIIIDHCSLTWGVDETVSTYTGDPDKSVTNVTFQWNIIGDALDCNTHVEGCHSKGLLLQHAEQISMHHNLFANNGARNPMILSGEHDMVNNVTYNWGGSVVKIENRYGSVFLNYVKNYLVPGEDSDMTENGIQVKTPGINLYLEDNIAEHARPNDSFPEDAIVNFREPGTVVATRYPFPVVTTTSAKQAYDDVLEDVGANLPQRDSADEGTINGVKNRTGRIIDYPSDVGGYPVLATGTAPVDSDADGMPDAWEISKGLNPNDSSDGSQDRNNDGYTNIEEYLNELCGDETAPVSDCNGDEGGTAYIDDCEVCVGGNTGNDSCTGITGITIDNCPSTALEKNTTYVLSATVVPSTEEQKEVVWSSSDSTIAIVNAQGVLTALTSGASTIRASTEDGTLTEECIVEVIDGIEAPNAGVLSIGITTKKDDAEESPSGKVDLNSSDIELVEDKGTQTIGLRFRNIAIPQGAIITKAYIQFTVDEQNSGAANFTIKGHDTNNAPIFNSLSDYNISNRPTTDSNVNWNPSPWTSIGETGETQRTPDIKTIVQEIVDRDGWLSNSSMAFIIQGSGERTAESYDGSPDKAAVLNVEFVTSSESSFKINTDIITAATFENKEGNVRIFPNPASKSLAVSSAKEMVRTELYNGTTGQMMLSHEINSGYDTQMGISRFTDGLYLLRIWYASGDFSYHKVIISK